MLLELYKLSQIYIKITTFSIFFGNKLATKKVSSKPVISMGLENGKK